MLDMILLEVHEAELRALLATPDGSEASAYLLLGSARIGADPWDGNPRRRLVTHRVVPVPDEDRISASGTHVTWSTHSFVRLLKAAEAKGMTPSIVHTHPGGRAFFSDQDDANEAELLTIVENRSGDGQEFASLVLGGDGSACARLWTTPGRVDPCRRVQVAGRRISFYGSVEVANDEHLVSVRR